MMNNKTIALLTTGFLMGVVFAPAPGRKTRRDVASTYNRICNQFQKWFSNKKNVDLDLEKLKMEIHEIEDYLTLESKIRINQLIDKVDNKS